MPVDSGGLSKHYIMKFSIKQFIYNLDLPLDIVKQILLYLSPCDFKMRHISLEYKNMRMSKQKNKRFIF